MAATGSSFEIPPLCGLACERSAPERPAGGTPNDERFFLRYGKGFDNAFETTLSGRVHLGRLRRWKAAGYSVEIVFLRLLSPAIAVRRIAARVKQGGHIVPTDDIVRRFSRGWENFERLYKPLADAWTVYDNSGAQPVLTMQSP
jgi:predicted ABC-type ATPase